MDFPGGSEGKVSVYNAGDLGSIPGLGRSAGEGNGNPLQYYCLKNPMDRGAWQATVHGVAKSRTRLSDFTFLSFHFRFILEINKENTKAVYSNTATERGFQGQYILNIIFHYGLPQDLLKLEDNYFTMSCQFLLYNKVNQL